MVTRRHATACMHDTHKNYTRTRDMNSLAIYFFTFFLDEIANASQSQINLRPLLLHPSAQDVYGPCFGLRNVVVIVLLVLPSTRRVVPC